MAVGAAVDREGPRAVALLVGGGLVDGATAFLGGVPGPAFGVVRPPSDSRDRDKVRSHRETHAPSRPVTIRPAVPEDRNCPRGLAAPTVMRRDC